jgi:hypothetical protein
MNNVTNLASHRVPADNAAHMYDGRGGDDRLLHDLHSPLMFTAYERPLWYEGKTGNKFDNTGHKALVRMINDAPVCLNVVKNTYKVVQNDELFAAIHAGLRTGVGDDVLSTAKIRDKTSYHGAVCFREYIFPDVSITSPERDKIAFRIVIQNGFGTGAIKLLAGAIDFFCTNGLVIGEYTSTYAKHTKGLQISKFEEAVRGSVHMFWQHKDFYSTLAGKKVLDDASVCDWYVAKFGDRLGARLYHQYVSEAKTRGKTLWAVYSALTYYSSHSNGDFSLRNTGNDHAAATMMKRENDVRKAVADINEFMKLAA